jgi:hypothetical protein
MPLAGFEPTIPASEQPQTRTIDGATTETGCLFLSTPNLHKRLDFSRSFFFRIMLQLLVLHNTFALSQGNIFFNLVQFSSGPESTEAHYKLLVHISTSV